MRFPQRRPAGRQLSRREAAPPHGELRLPGFRVRAGSGHRQALPKVEADGAAVLLVSSDLVELLKLSNRILVLRNGSIIRELMGGEVDEEQLLAIASGMEEAGA